LAPEIRGKFSANRWGPRLTRRRSGIELRAIDSVSEGGLEVVGAFHSDRWGDFRTYFRFQLTATGEIRRLDIGQAS
jgi:hypothetical protein